MSLLASVSGRAESEQLMEFVENGIEHCRAGRWEKGAQYLGYVAERVGGTEGRTGLYFSYLGCAIARAKKQRAEGLALCEHAVKIEFYQPENWANLADVLLLAGKRSEAIDALLQGLRIDAQQPRLQELLETMGLRKRPVLPFLSRQNPLNHLLGAIRSQLSPPKRT